MHFPFQEKIKYLSIFIIQEGNVVKKKFVTIWDEF